MVQRMYGGIRRVDPDARVTVATSRSQVSSLTNQLGNGVSLSVEPARRDTFPAIILAAAYLRDVKQVMEDEAVVICPVDPYVDDSYFHGLKKIGELAQKDTANLVLMGIEPDQPSDKYGYILPYTNDEISKVKLFREKPDKETAAQYIRQGALWNGGIFACKISYLIRKAEEQLHFSDYDDLFSRYETLEKISFDYAVAEKEQDISVMRYRGMWKDLGTWSTLTQHMEEPTIGNVVLTESCENTHVINDLNIPVVCIGMKNAIVSASPQGILVSDKELSSQIKPVADAMKQDVMFAEKSWGSYQVLDEENEGLCIKIILKKGSRMNYHSHQRRDEVWVVVSGTGRTVVDGMEQNIGAGDVITMEAGCRHTVIAETELILFEIQLGKEISIDDKKKYRLY